MDPISKFHKNKSSLSFPVVTNSQTEQSCDFYVDSHSGILQNVQHKPLIKK